MIKAAMKYTLEDMKAYRKATKSIADIIIVFSAIFAIDTAALIAFQINGMETYARVSLIASQIIIALMAITLIIYSSNKGADQRLLEQMTKGFKGKAVNFEFSPEKFTFYAEGAEKDKNLKYSDITKVTATEDYFFIAVDEVGDLIVKKSAITEGGADKLEELLKNQVKEKFTEK